MYGVYDIQMWGGGASGIEEGWTQGHHGILKRDSSQSLDLCEDFGEQLQGF